MQVTITFDSPCRHAEPGATIANYTFETAQGAKISKLNDDLTGLDEWDQGIAIEDRTRVESVAFAPTATVEKKRLAAAINAVPAAGAKPELVKCSTEIAAALADQPPAMPLFDDLLAAARKGVEQPAAASLDWVSEDFYGIITTNEAGDAGRDNRANGWKPVKYLEVYRVKQYSPPVAKYGTKQFDGGGLWGTLSVIDIDAKTALCRAPLEASVGDRVNAKDFDDFEREVLLVLKSAWQRRRDDAETAMAGAALKHAP